MSSSDHLAQRLSFIGLGPGEQARIRDVQDALTAALPAALENFYAKLKSVPETRRFFSDDGHADHAKQKQLGHWERIASGRFDTEYVDAVTTVGRVHARIGLEPRWYIGGYALLVEELIGKVLEARWPRGRFGGQMPGATERGAEIGAIIKAALLDMDYAISVYLEASEAARLKAEAQARAIEQAKTTEREKAVACVSQGMAALAKGDLTFRMTADIPAEYAEIRDHFNDAMARLQEMVATIKTTSSAIAASSREISSGAEDLSSRTEQRAAGFRAGGKRRHDRAACGLRRNVVAVLARVGRARRRRDFGRPHRRYHRQ